MDSAAANRPAGETEDGVFEVVSLRPFYSSLSMGLGLALPLLLIIGSLALSSRSLSFVLQSCRVLSFVLVPLAVASLFFLCKAMFWPRTETVVFRDGYVDLWKLLARGKDDDHTLPLDALGYAVFHTTPLFGSAVGWNSLENSLVKSKFLYFLHFLLTYVFIAPVTLPLMLGIHLVARRATNGMGFMVCAVGYEHRGPINDFISFPAKYRCFYIAPTNNADAQKITAWFDERGIPCRFNRYPWSALLAGA